MSWGGITASRLRGLFRCDTREHELDDEIRFHLDMPTGDNERAWVAPADADYAAQRS